MLSKEIMIYLNNQHRSINLDLTGTSGNIFDNSMPASPDLAVMVENTGGSPQDVILNELQEPSYRILIRGQLLDTTKKLAQEIINLIGSFKKDCFAQPEELWDSKTTYSVNTVVENDNTIYIATQESTDIEPGVNNSWKEYWLELEGHFIHKCQAIQPRPVNIGRDDNDRFRFSTNFELRTGVKS